MSTFNLSSVSDMGGQKILGMSGSLNGYINTGNAFDKRYYKNDSVELSSSSKKAKTKAKDFAIFATIASLVIGAVILGKKGKLKGIGEKVTTFFKNFKTKGKTKDKKAFSFSKISDGAKKGFQSVKDGVSDGFSKIFKSKKK